MEQAGRPVRPLIVSAWVLACIIVPCGSAGWDVRARQRSCVSYLGRASRPRGRSWLCADASRGPGEGAQGTHGFNIHVGLSGLLLQPRGGAGKPRSCPLGGIVTRGRTAGISRRGPRTRPRPLINRHTPPEGVRRRRADRRGSLTARAFGLRGRGAGLPREPGSRCSALKYKPMIVTNVQFRIPMIDENTINFQGERWGARPPGRARLAYFY